MALDLATKRPSLAVCAFNEGARNAELFSSRKAAGKLPRGVVDLPHIVQRTRAEAAKILCWNYNTNTRRRAHYWLEWIRGFESLVPLPGDER